MCLVVAFALVASMALAEGDNGAVAPKKADKPAGEKVKGNKADSQPAKTALKGIYAQMAGADADLGLTDDQKAKLAKAADAKMAVDAMWSKEGEKGAKLAEAEKALKDAKAATPKDEAKVTQAQKALDALTAEKAAALKQAEQDILAVLTDEQRTKWNAYELYQAVIQQLGRKVTLTPEQKSKIRTMAAPKGDEWAKADAKAQKDIVGALKQQVEVSVLTAEQQNALKSDAPASKPAGEAGAKKPKGEKAAEKAPK
jgi:Spy/CpxP family protein refolding chaperone